MGTHPRFKAWHGILVAVFILGLVAGAHFWGSASAQDGTGGGAAADSSAVVAPPQDTSTREVIAVEGGAVDVAAGIAVGTNRPSASPGTPSQPVPQFSAINTPVWVNSQGPAQIVDDLIVYGLTEVKGGLINNGAVAPGGGEPIPPPKTLTLQLNASSPTTNITAGSINTDITKVDFNNPSSPAGDVVISSIAVKCNGTCSGISNIKLMDGGSQIGPTIPALIGNSATVNPTTPWTIPAADTPKILTIKADVASSPDTGTFSLDITTITAATSQAGQFTLSVTDTPVAGSNRTIIAPVALADLIVDLPPTTVSPASPQAGNSITFSGTVINNGGTNAASSSTRIRIDGVALTNAATGGLSPLGTETETWTGAWTATAGDHTVEVCADIGSVIPESNEGNNCASQTFTVTAAPTPLLAVAIAADTPPAQSVQAGTIGTRTTKFNLTAGSIPITITSVAVTRSGVSTDANLANVKLYDADAQIGATVASLSANKATFSSLNLPIAASSTKILTVTTDVSASAPAGNTFALRIAAAGDIIGTTASNGAPTVSGSATGNTFTVVTAAPIPTLTLTRVNIPAAGSALITGTNVTLLEFNAQMNSGSVNLKTLFVVPKNGKSGRITNLKLINVTAGATLDSVADSATVRGQDAYFFDVTSAPLSIGTSATRLKVTGDIVCGSAIVEDHIIEASGDITLVTPPAGGISGPPFATVSRTLTACPIPAPTVTYKCSSGKLYADIGWPTLGKGDNTTPTAGFYVDFDNEAVAANAFKTGAGQNGFWNTSSNYTTNATFSLNDNAKVAPYSLEGYNNFGGTAPNSLTNLTFGAKYQARIYYPKTGEHSLINAFTTPASCSGYTSFSLTDFSAPSFDFGGGSVEFSFPSVLHGDGESFPYRSASFIPQANAGFIETANAQAAPAALHPVYVFDDLYIYGNGATGPEPGNLFVKGGIVTEGNSNIGNVGSVTQFTGDVQVTGGNLSVGNLNVSGNLTVSGNIGAFYRKENTSSVYSGNDVLAPTSCESKDVLISCSGDSTLPASSGYRYYGAKASGTQCIARGGRLSGLYLGLMTVNVQGVCFSPNGLPIEQTAVPTPP